MRWQSLIQLRHCLLLIYFLLAIVAIQSTIQSYAFDVEPSAREVVMPPSSGGINCPSVVTKVPRVPLGLKDDVEPEMKTCFPATEPIPVLGVSVVHDSALFLPRLIQSIDYPVTHIVIVYNGLNQFLQKQVKAIQRDYQNVTLLRYPRPQSCAEGWNAVFNAFPDEPWFLMPNYDVFFPMNQLRKLAYAFPNSPAEHAYLARLNIAGFAQTGFAVKHTFMRRMGLFDENMFPAYYEDDDWEIRLLRAVPTPIVAYYSNIYHVHGLVQDTTYFSGQWRMHENGSAEQLAWHAAMVRIIKLNRQYLNRKWGCPGFWSGLGNCSQNTHPFNQSSMKYSDWVVDQQGREQRLRLLYGDSPILDKLLKLWNATWSKED